MDCWQISLKMRGQDQILEDNAFLFEYDKEFDDNIANEKLKQMQLAADIEATKLIMDNTQIKENKNG